MNDVKFCKCDADYMDWYGTLGYVTKNKKKGAGKGHKEVYELRELVPGAWNDYLKYLREVSPVNWVLTAIHMAYLDLRRDAMQQNDHADLDDFKAWVKIELRECPGVPMKLVRPYLKLTWDELRDPQRKRIEMGLVPIEY